MVLLLFICYRFLLMLYVCFFFFKQKAAYGWRISDWSSDVCSSDLRTLQSEAAKLEKALADLTEKRSRIDRAMFDPAAAGPGEKNCTMTELMKRRAEVEKAIESAEQRWIEATEALEHL